MITPWKNEKIRIVYERPEMKASVEIILSVFTVVGLLTLAIRPTLATVATLQKKIDDQTVVDNKLSTKISQLTKANADLATYANRIPDYSLAVMDHPDESGLAKRIAVIAKDGNLTLGSLNFTAIPLIGQQINLSDKEKGSIKPPLEKDGKIAHYSVEFDATGAPSFIFDFLSKLENMDRITLITTVDLKKEEIKASGTTPAVTDLRVIGKVDAYYVLVTYQNQ